MDLQLPPGGAFADAVGYAVALGIGLLVGAERERRQTERARRAAAGIRTFAIFALAGAVSFHLLGEVGLTAVAAIAGLLAGVSAWNERKQKDAGFTTEAALVLTVLLGGLAMREPGLAAMIGTTATVLLAARSPLHRFVGSVVTERELKDGLILAAASLIVLPLLPQKAPPPFAVLNPREIWTLAILVLAVSGVGHIAVRMVGVRFGLPVAGFLGGFVSSAATIGAMAARARSVPAETSVAAAAAVLSTVATMAQLAVVLAAVDLATLRIAAPSLLAGGAVAALLGLIAMARSHGPASTAPADDRGAFSLGSALTFAAMVSVVLLLADAAQRYFGEAGLVFTSGLAGLADAHTPAISAAMLVAAGRLSPSVALTAILIGLSTNTATKLTLAAGGGPGFLLRVGPALALVTAATWIPAILHLHI